MSEAEGRARSGIVLAAVGVIRGRGALGAVAANLAIEGVCAAVDLPRGGDIIISVVVVLGLSKRRGLRVDFGAGVDACIIANLQRKEEEEDG